MNNEITIRFGGDNHIKLQTLTEFLEHYNNILYKINEEVGCAKDDLVIQVFPPEAGSFKIKISPEYQTAILNTLSAIVSGSFVVLFTLWVTKKDGKTFTFDEVKEIVKMVQKEDEEKVTPIVYNTYNNIEVKQSINQSFKVVSNDGTIQSIDITKEGTTIIDVSRNEFEDLVIDDIELQEIEAIPEEIMEDEEVIIVIKTIHFEGGAKWGFIWRGYEIKAYVRDENFLNRLNNEPFRRGDQLRVKLRKRKTFDEGLNTYVVDQKSYQILEVIEHISKPNQGKLEL
ncbi:hypothetical protein [Carboxylicivirga sp. RSCT41]|uniref:hypothetical protein n=1 Tax=Carboxylicivirga agarovorans TaxID=3417570 RepID=UPI003D34C758